LIPRRPGDRIKTGGFQIAMRDAGAMRLVERVGDLDRDGEYLLDRPGAFRASQSRRQRLALQMLHDPQSAR
jgi:hypothetical protein